MNEVDFAYDNGIECFMNGIHDNQYHYKASGIENILYHTWIDGYRYAKWLHNYNKSKFQINMEKQNER